MLFGPPRSWPPAAGPRRTVLGQLRDLNMLVCTSGRERTEAELRRLLTGAGFAVRRIVPCLLTGYSIVEAVPQP
jgi:hypothetical protein